jgi:hypothetical protein
LAAIRACQRAVGFALVVSICWVGSPTKAAPWAKAPLPPPASGETPPDGAVESASPPAQVAECREDELATVSYTQPDAVIVEGADEDWSEADSMAIQRLSYQDEADADRMATSAGCGTSCGSCARYCGPSGCLWARADYLLW